MTPARARELILPQIGFGGGYNRNAVRLILAEVQREHGSEEVDRIIRELGLDEAFGLKVGSDFSKVTG